MFRKNVKEHILEILQKSGLTEHAFKVEFGKNSTEKLVSIKYVLLESFRFEVDALQNNEFWILAAPGEQLLSAETFQVNSVAAVLDFLSNWVRAVESEDGLGPETDSEITKLKESFFEQLVRHVKDENRHFTQEEAEDLIARLEKLEQQMERVMASQKKSATEVQSVKKLLQESKRDIGTMTKRKWLVAGGGKLFNAIVSIAKSKEGRAAITDSVKGLLGDGTQQ